MTAAIIGLLVGAALALFYAVMADEIQAWLPYLSRCLVRSAAGKLPQSDRDRYEADWLAERRLGKTDLFRPLARLSTSG